MLQSAPPETIEQAHEEAFRRLTPEQRRRVLGELARALPANERRSLDGTATDDPRVLARLATRAEVRQPGIMERTLGTTPGAGFGAGLLGSFAAGFAGSMVANSFFSALGGFGEPQAAGSADDDDDDEFGDSEFGGHVISGRDLSGGGAADHGSDASAVADADQDFDGIGGFDPDLESGADFDGSDFDA